MQLIVEKNEAAISQVAADLLFGKMISKHRVNLAITAVQHLKKPMSFWLKK